MDGVISTNDFSTLQKYVLNKLGQQKDDQIEYFLRKKKEREYRSNPMTNRGQFARIQTMRLKLVNLIEKSEKKITTILNIGCGYDTFILNCDTLNINFKNINYIELDYSQVMRKKLSQLNKSELKTKYDSNISLFKSVEHLGFDLTNPNDLNTLLEKLESIQTENVIIQAECVFGYVKNQQIHNLLNQLQKQNVSLLMYEFNLCNDPSNVSLYRYCRQMLSNLEQSDIYLEGVKDVGGMQDWIQMLEGLGYSVNQSSSMLDCQKNMEPNELNRVSKIEFLDELEEFNTIMSCQFILEGKQINLENTIN